MTRFMRVVPADQWVLSDQLGHRYARLINGISPEELLLPVSADAQASAERRAISLCWEESKDSLGYFRLSAQVPLTELTFDQLFNGNSGYRAQYYLSQEEGILFNHDIIGALLSAIEASYLQKPLVVSLEFVQRSLKAPHAKVWVYEEQMAFNSADSNTLSPPRWVENDAILGRRVPLPAHLKLDLKGTFINFDNNDLYINEIKLDRACDLFCRGFS